MSKNISKIHLEILDKDRAELLQSLIPYTKDFVLSGGTALALQLAHRKSFDFDLFSASPIPKTLLHTLSKNFKIENITVDTTSELTFFADNHIKLTFLHYYFESCYPIIKLENGLKLFSIKDIAVQKAHTIGRRGEYRDSFDMYTILKGGHSTLSEIIQNTKKAYGGAFDKRLFFQQLVYFDDMLSFELIPIPGKPTPQPEEIKKFFEEITKNYNE